MLSLGICTITNLGDVLPQIFLGCCTNPTYFLIGLPAVLAWVLAASVLLWRVMAHPPFYYNYILYAFVFAFNCIQLYYNYILFAFVLHSIVAIMAHPPSHYNYILCAFDFAYSTVAIMAYPPLCYNNILYAFVITYDKASANTASSVPKTSKFKSGDRVVKMVLNT